MLAAHSVLDPHGKLLAVCPNKEIAREIGETFCIITDLNYTCREATPDEIRGLLDKPAPQRGQCYRVVSGVDKTAVVIPDYRDTPTEPVDN
jgi:hypothetical protein